MLDINPIFNNIYHANAYPDYVDIIILVADLSQNYEDIDQWIRLILENIKEDSKFMIFGSKADQKKQ